MAMADLRANIVRILDSGGKTAGTGFVVTAEGLIATCAHVVELAGSKPDDTIGLIFHLNKEEREATVERKYWRYWQREDIAILRLEGPLPDAVEPLLLGSCAGSEGHSFHTFGFPKQKPFEGMVGEGTITGWTR